MKFLSDEAFPNSREGKFVFPTFEPESKYISCYRSIVSCVALLLGSGP